MSIEGRVVASREVCRLISTKLASRLIDTRHFRSVGLLAEYEDERCLIDPEDLQEENRNVRAVFVELVQTIYFETISWSRTDVCTAKNFSKAAERCMVVL